METSIAPDTNQTKPAPPGTPGPWQAAGGLITAREAFTNAIVAVLPVERHNEGRPVADVEADARLIAAAPDLLEALRRSLALLEYHAGDGETREEMTKLRAVLTRATPPAQKREPPK